MADETPSTVFGGDIEGGDKEWKKRVAPAFEVIDAIMRGVYMPEPTDEEAEMLGKADYDPELRYRVSKDTLQHYYGKPRQQVEVNGDANQFTFILPEYMPREALPSEVVEDAEFVEGSDDLPEVDEAPERQPTVPVYDEAFKDFD